MHICISAYACDPSRGSEPGIGWNLIRAVARRHRVWAVTRRKNRPSISRELERAPVPNLEMVYYDVPDAALALKHGQIGIEVYYRLWHLLTRDVIHRLHDTVGLDLTQHVTFGRYWGPTSVAYGPVPFIWGPVGGGETAPASFYADFGLRGRTYEYLRGAARRSGEWDPSIRKTARGAALALAVTQETRRRLLALGTRRVELFSAMGFAEAQYEQLRRMPRADAPAVRFVSIGRLLHWKGFHLGLKAFAAAALPEAEYWIVGEGPELGRLQNLVRMLGIQERVKFWGAMSRPEALNRLASCHVLVHPSLHDSGGWVCLEAMAGARPVICLDLGGPSEQVTDATGIRVPAGDPQQAVSDLAEAMTRLGEDVPLREAMGRAGQERVRDAYLWEKKGEQLDAFFATVLRPGVAADAS